MDYKAVQFAIKPLNQSNTVQVLPLIQTLKSDITTDQWMDYVDSFIGRDSRECGIITVKNSSGYYMGVLCYKIVEDVTHQIVMDVSNYVTADILGRNDISEKLLEWLEDQASERGCQAIHLTIDIRNTIIPENGYTKSIPNQLISKGYVCDAVRLCKKLNDNSITQH
ncbi:hypothetical protein WH96_17965 [Kiloniella spongiae]|uniref:N-acetyltransferase domain-containing protein n=1 Tax=Kiloniella spongiae TaxID=1489064 RepID=A0A0H2MA15_9PROT|nr:hypothetical protein WH96_17965 [Kiloniella spongiae]